MNKQHKTKGFTLVELLVAIAIFAVLSALGWKIFDYLVKVKDRNAMHEENLAQLQEGYLQIQRDMLQIVPLSSNIGGEIQSALILSNQQLKFSKSGVTDPLNQGLSPFERIEYQYNLQEKKLYRLKYNSLNLIPAAQPLSSVMLSDVEDFQISVLNPAELIQWPENTQQTDKPNVLLPKGVKIKFKLRGVEYEWMFSLLNTDFMNKKT